MTHPVVTYNEYFKEIVRLRLRKSGHLADRPAIYNAVALKLGTSAKRVRRIAMRYEVRGIWDQTH